MKSRFFHLGILFIASIVACVGFSMWYATLSAKSAAVANLQNQIITKTETVHHVAFARAALAEIADDEMTVQSYFVPETGVVAFINELETRGRAQGTVVRVLSVSTRTTGTQPMFEFMLAIDGPFDTVMRTIGGIEYAPYAISISTLSLAQNDENSWHADLKLAVGSVRAATSTP